MNHTSYSRRQADHWRRPRLPNDERHQDDRTHAGKRHLMAFQVEPDELGGGQCRHRAHGHQHPADQGKRRRCQDRSGVRAVGRRVGAPINGEGTDVSFEFSLIGRLTCCLQLSRYPPSCWASSTSSSWWPSCCWSGPSSNGSCRPGRLCPARHRGQAVPRHRCTDCPLHAGRPAVRRGAGAAYHRRLAYG